MYRSCIAACTDISDRIAAYSEACIALKNDTTTSPKPPTCDLNASTDSSAECARGCRFTPSSTVCNPANASDCAIVPGTCDGEAEPPDGSFDVSCSSDMSRICLPSCNAHLPSCQHPNIVCSALQCYTLATLEAELGGCAQPWCTLQPDGSGQRGQGWLRDCNYLCGEKTPLVATQAQLCSVFPYCMSPAIASQCGRCGGYWENSTQGSSRIVCTSCGMAGFHEAMDKAGEAVENFMKGARRQLAQSSLKFCLKFCLCNPARPQVT